MKSESFVYSLANIAPKREDFEKYSVSETFINDEIQRYHCVPRNDIQQSQLFLSEVLELLNRYDCSRLEIGLVNFMNDYIESANYIQFGTVEMDLLVVNKVTLEVEVLDYACPDHTIWYCASNGESFLDALFLSAQYLKTIMFGKLLDANSEGAESTVNICAYLAGGSKYRSFYDMLLNYME
jgi:hypothetical protein